MSIAPQTPDPLVSIVYVSSGLRVMDEAETVALLSQARRNNERSGLTGMLLYRDGNFLQVLEGPQTAVASTLQRIKQDQRHVGMMILQKQTIQSRSFSEWAMAFRQPDSAELLKLPGYSPFMELSFNSEAFKAQGGFGYRMLLQFREKMR